MSQEPRTGRGLRFSLRTLFVMVTLLSLWLAYQMNWIHQRHEYWRQVWQEFHEKTDEAGLLSSDGMYTSPCPAPWSLRILGETGSRLIRRLDNDTNGERARQLFPEVEHIYEP